ncbi:MAG TPA: hypothetical protein VGY54_10455, partial [Polyangiaceae bacterium]|nr:hypothetical protein [Polyangiaceae bacterium]
MSTARTGELVEPALPVSGAGGSAAPASADAIKQLGFVAAIGTLGYVFWIVGAMEMVERLAYYGVKAVATLYAKDPASKGGLGVTQAEFGTILGTWALIQ